MIGSCLSVKQWLAAGVSSSPIAQWKKTDEAQTEQEIKTDIRRHIQWLTSEIVPDLGTLDRRKISALIGLCPYSRDNGNFSGRRMIWGGRSDIRSMLHITVLSAVRYNPEIKAFYQHLTGRGKVFKVAMTACMRKMITIINAIIWEGEKNELTRWLRPEYLLLSL